MLGAVGAHLSLLDDGGVLFIMGLVALAPSVVALVIRRSQISCFERQSARPLEFT